MDTRNLIILYEIRHLDRIWSNYFMQRKFKVLEEIDEVEYLMAYSRLKILDRTDLIDELKKQHFLKIVRIHPDTKNIPVHRVMMFWETIERNSN
jgi:hypothetical protein